MERPIFFSTKFRRSKAGKRLSIRWPLTLIDVYKRQTYGIANFTTMNPGSELEIHADRYIRKDCILTYNGGHLLMICLLYTS